MAVSPFAWRPCCLRTIQRPLAASPCGRLSRPRSTISQSDCRRAFGPFSPFRLGGSYKLSLEPDGSPLFTRNLWTACRRYEPRKHLKTLAMARHEILPSPCGIRSATSTTIDFGANCPFTFVPAYCLPVYASQRPLPDTTQDSVRGCRLSFAAVAISGDMVSYAFKAQPAQNRTCGFPAYGSHLG